MKKFNRITFVIMMMLVLGFLFSGCEDVITYDLKSSESQIVIEGAITDEGGPHTVKISKTTNYFTPGEIEKVSNAEVIISDDKGNSENLNETSPGVYQTVELEAIYNTEYFLKVRVDGELYEASTTLLEPLKLDSAEIKIEDDEYIFSVFFRDNPNQKDYAVLNFKHNNKEFESPVVYSDRLTDGNYVEGEAFGIEKDSVKAGQNIVDCKMRTVDFETYSYFNTLSAALADDQVMFFNPTAPENPRTNISNNALGYFGGYSISRLRIVFNK